MMRSQLLRLAMVVLSLSTWAVVSAPVANAKVLPIESVKVTTQHPTTGEPVEVELRFMGGGELGDFAWENAEVYVVAAARTDANGWPLTAADNGIAVPLRLSPGNVYRGRFTVERPGDYVVLDRSAVQARGDPAVNLTRPTAVPVRVGIERPPAKNTTWWPWFVAGSAVAISVVTALCIRRRRRAGPVDTPQRSDDHGTRPLVETP